MPPDFALSIEEVIELPLDELALYLLRDVVGHGAWNTRNWLNAADSAYPDEPAHHALQEAWAWLYRKGLVATDWSKGGEGSMFVTRDGQRAADEGLSHLRAAELIDLDLHPLIAAEARPQFLLGKYEFAAFASLRRVEVRIRELAPEAPANLVGVKLARWAWGPHPPAPLADTSLDGGEQQATADLFAGALGLFKNSTSHRIIELDDPARAAEIVFLADLLMRLLDDAERRRQGSGLDVASG